MKKKIFFLLILFIIPIICYGKNITITTTNPKVGKELSINIDNIDDNNLKYIWTIDDIIVSEDKNYIPTASDYESWIKVTIYDINNNELGTDKIYFSKLPVIYINTTINQELIDRNNYVDGTMLIQGNKEYDIQYDGNIEIKGRGTSSWHYSKKPYKLKLDKKTDLFGFGESKHYVLLANYLDPSLLRNKIGYELSNKLGLISTDSIWVDVIFNGKYIGNYQLVEHIRIGEELIDITDYEDIASDAAKEISKKENFTKDETENLETLMTENLEWLTTDEITFKEKKYKVSDYIDYDYNVNGGYLFELDTKKNKEITNFTTNSGLIVNVSKPEYTLTNNEMLNYVKTYFEDFIDALCSVDGYNDKGVHYTELLDIDSMVSYWLTMEIMSNEDASVRSRFLYKEIDGKLTFGPVWDFDISSGSYRSYFSATTFNVTGNIFLDYLKQDIMKEFTDDPYFQMKVQEKYWEIRPYLEELIKDNGILDNYRDYLYESAVKNEMLWTDNNPMNRSFTGNKGDFEIFKNFLKTRIEWLDKVFDTEDDTTKNMKFILAKNDFNKSDKINIELTNAIKNNNIHSSGYLINENDNLNINIKLTNLNNAKIYINGIFYKEYTQKNEINDVILNKYLTEKDNKKNVITIISTKNNKNYINYVTVSKNIDIIEEKNNEEYICIPNKENLIHIDERDATNDKYGIKECYYSNECEAYYMDINGLNKVSPSDVITSIKTSNNYFGRRQHVLIAIAIGIELIIIIILIIKIIKEWYKYGKKIDKHR